MNRRKATNPDSKAPCELSAQQQLAIDLLVSGKSLAEVARVLDLSRQTLSEWANQHYGFRAVLNQRRQEIWSAAGDALRSMLPAALAALAAELEGPNRLRAVQVILRAAAGGDGLGVPSGSTSAEEIEAADEEAAVELVRRRGFAMAGI
jgi:transposase-like protein